MRTDGDTTRVTVRRGIVDRKPLGKPSLPPFVHVDADGTLMWGEFNGRGPGLGVHKLRLQPDGTLRGTMAIVGLPRDLLPPDFEMPTIHVELKRRGQ